MKLEVGKFYQTRDGRKAEVLRDNLEGNFPVLVLIENRVAHCYTVNGCYYHTQLENSQCDLISEWQEPLDFDWTCLPKWANAYIAMDEIYRWNSYESKPSNNNDRWVAECICEKIPTNYAPTNFTGNWKESLFKNPNL